MKHTLVDLTLTVRSEGMSLVPGNPGMQLEQVRTHEKNRRSSQRLALSTHLGTHVDAPYHFDPHGLPIDQMPLERYTGEGVCLDLRHVAREGHPILRSDLEQAGLNRMGVKDKIVVLYTAWAERAFGGTRYYTEGPYLGLDGATWLLDLGVNAVAVDFPIDHHQPVVDITSDSFFPVHRCLLPRGVPLIENLINLDTLLGKRFELWALPLKLLGGDGSPARVVARLLP